MTMRTIPHNGDRKRIEAVRRVKPAREARKQKSTLRTNAITRAEYDKTIGDRLSEDAWREQYRGYAFDCGFRRQYHTYRSDRSDKGFPDDVMLNVESGRTVYIEGKREVGRLSYDQVLWLDDLARIRDKRGTPDVYVARPSDRDGLWAALSGRGEPLHQWCLSLTCQRCTHDRDRMVIRLPSGGRVKPTGTGRKRRPKKSA